MDDFDINACVDYYHCLGQDAYLYAFLDMVVLAGFPP